MNELKECTEKMFEDIKHFDEEGNEYWSARELMPLLEYSKWERFSNAIDNAKVACEKSGYNIWILLKRRQLNYLQILI